MTNWPIEGQDKAVDFLQRSLAAGRLSHAYLIVGPEHVGKMVLAKSLSQAVNCSGHGLPCGECLSCSRIASGKHADVKVVVPGFVDPVKNAHRTEISIDDIEELQRLASTPPYEGRCKVFIIDGAERLSNEATNRLLKTLEEPAPSVLFLLLTSKEHALLPTVVSRCQRLELAPLPVETARQLLERRWGASVEQAVLLAHLSRGCLGWAIAALRDQGVMEGRKTDMDVLAGLLPASYEDRFALVTGWLRKHGRSRDRLEDLLHLWLEWWRDILLVKAGCSDSLTNIDRREELGSCASMLDNAEVLKGVQAIRSAMERLAANANPRLCLEALMLEVPQAMPPPTSEAVGSAGRYRA